MAGAKRGLGRGLGALFGEDTVEEVISEEKATARKHESAVSETKNKTENHTVNKKQNAEKNAVARNNVQKTEKKEAQTSEKEILNVVQEISPQEQEKEVQTQAELELKISEIEPNRDQPRKAFDEEQLEELADSIRKYGVLQPLLVQKKGESYEIIAGERRWRAAKLAGLKMIPAVIREYSPQQAMEIALIENVQREDLNPIEEAQAYQRLMQEFSLKQEEIAERVSKNRTTITNCMRLLNLAPEVQQMLIEGRIASGHARALLAVADPYQQLELAKKTLRNAGKIDTNNTTTLRYLREVNARLKEKSPSKKPKDDDLISYQSGNETIIMPKRFKESSIGATLVYIVIGLIVGTAITAFLIVPSVRNKAKEDAQRKLVEASDTISTNGQTIKDLEGQVEDLKNQLEEQTTNNEKVMKISCRHVFPIMDQRM